MAFSIRQLSQLLAVLMAHPNQRAANAVRLQNVLVPVFELTDEPFDVNGISVTETKRITLDAGQNLDHFQL